MLETSIDILNLYSWAQLPQMITIVSRSTVHVPRYNMSRSACLSFVMRIVISLGLIFSNQIPLAFLKCYVWVAAWYSVFFLYSCVFVATLINWKVRVEALLDCYCFLPPYTLIYLLNLLLTHSLTHSLIPLLTYVLTYFLISYLTAALQGKIDKDRIPAHTDSSNFYGHQSKKTASQ